MTKELGNDGGRRQCGLGPRRPSRNPKPPNSRNGSDSKQGERKRKIYRPKYVEDSRISESLIEQSREFANAALYHLNYKENTDFELVEPGFFQGAGISLGLIYHINFTASWRGDPDDPLQTFFAQIRLMCVGGRATGRTMYVDCCVNLGPTHLLPEKVYLGGCQYCFSSIYHPIGGCEKLLLGCENDDARWLYGDDASDSDSDSASVSASASDLL